MNWRPYQWGDREALGLQPIRTELVPLTITLVGDRSEVLAVFGISQLAAGTFEIFLDLRGGRATWPVYRALHQAWSKFEGLAGVKRFVAFIADDTVNGMALAKVAGLSFEAYLPGWWDGESRTLMGRVL